MVRERFLSLILEGSKIPKSHSYIFIIHGPLGSVSISSVET